MTEPQTPRPGEGEELPTTASDYIRRGWTYHVQGELEKAANDFRRAIELDSRSVEGYYGLGLANKIQRNKKEAADAFRKTIALVKSDAMKDDTSRASMLRHLSEWHLETIESGTSEEPAP